jgi:hypothetical protein
MIAWSTLAMPWPELKVERVGVSVLNLRLAHGWSGLSSEASRTAQAAGFVLPQERKAMDAWLLLAVASAPSVEHLVGRGYSKTGRSHDKAIQGKPWVMKDWSPAAARLGLV